MRVILFLSVVGLITLCAVAMQLAWLIITRRKPPEKIEEFPPIRRVK